MPYAVLSFYITSNPVSQHICCRYHQTFDIIFFKKWTFFQHFFINILYSKCVQISTVYVAVSHIHFFQCVTFYCLLSKYKSGSCHHTFVNLFKNDFYFFLIEKFIICCIYYLLMLSFHLRIHWLKSTWMFYFRLHIHNQLTYIHFKNFIFWHKALKHLFIICRPVWKSTFWTVFYFFSICRHKVNRISGTLFFKI